ncbi:MAG: hypothetical protein ABFS45_05420 [Pseudomonadota bacterium]
MKTRYTALVTVLTAGWLSATQAMDQIAIIPNAYGTEAATLICEKTPEGLKATDIVLLTHLHIDHISDATNIQRGDLCLTALGEYPTPYTSLRDIARLKGNDTGANTTIGESIIFIVNDPKSSGSDITPVWVGFHDGSFDSYIVTCDLGEEGLATRSVDSLRMSDTSSYIDQPCGKTVTELSSNGTQVQGPFAAMLGVDETGKPTGGAVWFLAGSFTDAVETELLECNLDPLSNNMTVVYRETNKLGVDTDAVGTPCLAALAASKANGRFTTSGPIPIPQGGTVGSNRAYFVYDIGIVSLDLD